MTNEPTRRSSQLTDELACRAQRAESADFDELYGRVAPELAAWARMHASGTLGSLLEAEDLVQEAELRALQRLPAWDPDKGTFRAWLFGIARNVLRHALERVLTERRVRLGDETASEALAALPASTTSIIRAAARAEGIHLLLERLERLEEEDRLLLVHRGLEGMSHDQVAGLLEITPEAAENRWRRLRDRLRAEGIGEREGLLST